MKRITILATLTAWLVLLAASAALGQEPQGAPNNINVQGRLAASGGGPVTAGNYTFRFKIFDDSTAGVEIWPAAIGEDHTIAVATDGLWNARLGKDFPLSVGYMDDTTRWLQVTVTPPAGPVETFSRVKLTSAPFTLESGQLNAKTGAEYVEVAGDVMTGALSMDNDNNATLEASLFGSGGEGALELYNSSGSLRSKLWVGGGGALNMYDASGDAQVSLFTDEGSAGARLILKKPDGSDGAQLIGGSAVNGSLLTMYGGSGLLNITLDGDIVGGGDGSVVFPSGAINAVEIKDEPGVASKSHGGFVFVSAPGAGVNFVCDSVDLVAPAAGYAIVSATGYALLNHTTATSTNVNMVVSTLRAAEASGYPPGSASLLVPSVLPSSLSYRYGFNTSRVFSVSAGANRFYLNAFMATGTDLDVGQFVITALYVPSAYNTVALQVAKAGVPEETSSSVDGSPIR